jgi:hypothetical protein
MLPCYLFCTFSHSICHCSVHTAVRANCRMLVGEFEGRQLGPHQLHQPPRRGAQSSCMPDACSSAMVEALSDSPLVKKGNGRRKCSGPVLGAMHGGMSGSWMARESSWSSRKRRVVLQKATICMCRMLHAWLEKISSGADKDFVIRVRAARRCGRGCRQRQGRFLCQQLSLLHRHAHLFPASV